MGKPTFEARIQSACGDRPITVGRRACSDFWLHKKVWTSEFIGGFKQTRGTETSQYPEERTSTETPLVVASERGPGQWRMQDNRNLSGKQGLRG
jgi:hypothetical protein